MGFNGIYDGIPSGNLLQVAIENGPVEIVDLPIDSMVIFQFAKCKRLPEGTWRFPLSHDGISPS
jgi:hypothetical protein